MKTTFMRSSSAAYRSIRQHEAKNGKTENVVVEKLGDKIYLRIKKTVDIEYPTFAEQTPNITSNGKTFKYFADGGSGEGYYELKTGDRRRPNSEYMDLYTAYVAIHEGTATIK